MLLEVNEIITLYGQSLILDKVSLAVDRKEVVGLLGRNGAGKTTTLRSVMGLTPAKSGTVKFKGIEITHKQPFQIARLGVGYAPDDRRIFPDLTTEENLLLAGRIASKNKKSESSWNFDKVMEVFPILTRVQSSKGGGLSGGEQKMLATGRALMQNPDLLLLDEPCEGLMPLMVQHMGEAILKIKEMGVTILIAEQNFRFCQKIIDRAYILEKGVICFVGNMQDINRNEEVIYKYLSV
jgi:branched-chain amino acid transport system ATP-binding protein